MIYVGFDPGLSGGIAFYSETGTLATHKMPVLKAGTKKVIDLGRIKDLLNEYPADHLTGIIERVNAMPGQGVTSMFTFGEGFGMVKGLLTGMGIAYELVLPQRWQKQILNGIPADLKKQRGVLFCSQRFPRLKNLSDGEADALCMALYGAQLTNSV